MNEEHNKNGYSVELIESPTKDMYFISFDIGGAALYGDYKSVTTMLLNLIKSKIARNTHFVKLEPYNFCDKLKFFLKTGKLNHPVVKPGKRVEVDDDEIRDMCIKTLESVKTMKTKVV